MLRVLHEVKVREDEYTFVKDIESRIDGLSPSTQLARRERRLLWHGELLWHVDDHGSKRNPSNVPKQKAILSPSNGVGRLGTPAIVLSPCPDDSSYKDDASNKGVNSVHIFIFSDVIILGKATGKRRSNFRWRLLPEVGMARVLGVKTERGAAGTS